MSAVCAQGMGMPLPGGDGAKGRQRTGGFAGGFAGVESFCLRKGHTLPLPLEPTCFIFAHLLSLFNCLFQIGKPIIYIFLAFIAVPDYYRHNPKMGGVLREYSVCRNPAEAENEEGAFADPARKTAF